MIRSSCFLENGLRKGYLWSHSEQHEQLSLKNMNLNHYCGVPSWQIIFWWNVTRAFSNCRSLSITSYSWSHGRAINGSIWMSGCFFLGTKSMMFGGVEKCWKNISLIIIIIIIIIPPACGECIIQHDCRSLSKSNLTLHRFNWIG